MPKINILNKEIAELIAAGEVVERPASIVKELVENAIDAGSTDIKVEIKGGGISFIRVADNGCGIDRDDIPKAFLRHATSKVSGAGDLDNILTLGFRGEALASISAVSKVELTTKTAEDNEGTSYTIEGGEFVDIAPAARPDGTTITVRDIFFNTPARMKFLKKDIGEGNAVALVMDKCALSHPEIAFRFIRDGQAKLRTSGSGDLRAVIRAVYGGELAGQMLPVSYMLNGNIRVTGFVSKPGETMPSRSYQNFFINGRYIRSKTCSAALEEAYKGRIMAGRYPACALNVEIMAHCVDVNVHPAKIEVRFADERPVFSCVYYAVKTALMDGVSPAIPTAQKPAAAAVALGAGAEEYVQPRISSDAYREMLSRAEAGKSGGTFRSSARMGVSNIDIFTDEDVKTQKYRPPSIIDKKEIAPESTILDGDAVNQAQNDTVLQEPLGDGLPADKEPAEYRLIGEVMNTYILLESEKSLVLVDKHAAHERLIYERIMDNIAYGNRQVLFTPLPITLPKDEYCALTENIDKLSDMGFLIEDFGGETALVREVPIELGENDIRQAVGEIAVKLASGGRDITPEALERLYYGIACKSAVRAGDKNSLPELDEIIRRLAENPQITHCPHGRPVSVGISRDDVAKMFGRTGNRPLHG